MNSVSEVRRTKLLRLLEQHGTLAKLNEALGRVRTDATLSQYVNRSKDSRTGNPKGMGTRMAREIEQKLKLPDGWMDSEEDVPLSADALRIARELDSLDQAGRAWLLGVWASSMELWRSQDRSKGAA